MKAFSYFSTLTLVILVSCSEKEVINNDLTQSQVCVKNCSSKPEQGLCQAAFKRYFFNTQTMKCDSFIWGGCNGVVPFETLDACVKCACK